MAKFNSLKPVAAGLALAASALTLSTANAAQNPFATADLPAGYQLAEHHEGKAGEAKCGGDKGTKGHEGKCGSEKAEKEGKCGEGKCGSEEARAKAAAEGKCGEGKCGEGKCGSDKAKEAGN